MTLFRLRLVEIGLPLALSIVSILLTLRYPLTEARCYEIKEALEAATGRVSELSCREPVRRVQLGQHAAARLADDQLRRQRDGLRLRAPARRSAGRAARSPSPPCSTSARAPSSSSGLVIWAIRVSSKPTTPKSSGTATSLAIAPAMIPAAISSLAANTRGILPGPIADFAHSPADRPTRTCSPDSRRRPCRLCDRPA